VFWGIMGRADNMVERVKKYSANRNGVDCISCRNEQRVKPTRSNNPKQQTEDESSWKEGKKQVK